MNLGCLFGGTQWPQMYLICWSLRHIDALCRGLGDRWLDEYLRVLVALVSPVVFFLSCTMAS